MLLRFWICLGWLAAEALACNIGTAWAASGDGGQRLERKSGSQRLSRTAPPEFSHPAGFYTSNLVLTVTSANPATVVRYTLDGSEPSASSPEFAAPLSMTNRSSAPNVLAIVPTVPGYIRPRQPVFKGFVIRARSFEPGLEPSEVVTRSYFVHPKGRARYSVPVLSLAADPGDFFDPDRGIYVPGRSAGGNYLRRGPAWQRPVHIEFFETNGITAFAQDGDVKIHGNTSPKFPIKGLDLDGTGGDGHAPFCYRIFPDRARDRFEHILLRPSGHDHHLAFMRDELMQSLAEEFGAETQAARLAVVFINGEYWGLHYLKEKQDAEFVAWHAKTKEIDYLEDYVEVKAGGSEHYDRMLSFIRKHELALPAHFEEVQRMMDVDNYIDYKAAEIFNYRWDIGNHRLWRPKTPGGRWRWLQYDNDVGWGGFWAVPQPWTFDMVEAVASPSGSLYSHNDETRTFLFRRLLDSESFKNQFVNRVADLLNTVYEPAHTVARVDALAAILGVEMPEHIARWRTPPSMEQWARNVEDLRRFARQRPDHVRRHVTRKFKLPGIAELTVNIAGASQAVVEVNSIKVSLQSRQQWQGTYFQGVPLTIRAETPAGQRLKAWKGVSQPATNTITIVLQRETSLTAVFEPDEDH